MNTVIETLYINTSAGLIAAFIVATLLSSIILKTLAKRHSRNRWIEKVGYRSARSAHQGFFRHHP